MNSLGTSWRNFEPVTPIAMAVDPLLQRIKEQLWLLAIGTVINDDPVSPWPIISHDFHNTSLWNLNPDSELLKDYLRILKTEDWSPIYQQSLVGWLSIWLTWLLRLNGYRVVFVKPKIGNIPQVKVERIAKAMNYLPQSYTVINKIPTLDGIHWLIDTIWNTVKWMLKMTTRK